MPERHNACVAEVAGRAAQVASGSCAYYAAAAAVAMGADTAAAAAAAGRRGCIAVGIAVVASLLVGVLVASATAGGTVGDQHVEDDVVEVVVEVAAIRRLLQARFERAGRQGEPMMWSWCCGRCRRCASSKDQRPCPILGEAVARTSLRLFVGVGVVGIVGVVVVCEVILFLCDVQCRLGCRAEKGRG